MKRNLMKMMAVTGMLALAGIAGANDRLHSACNGRADRGESRARGAHVSALFDLGQCQPAG